MSEPAIKRYRITDLTRQISEQALQKLAKATLEANKQNESLEYELRRKNRKTTMLKPISVRPLPLQSSNIRERFKYSIISQSHVNVVFGCSGEHDDSNLGPKFDCPVYEYKNRRKLIYFPLVAGPKNDRLYACVDCWHVYCVMTVLRNRLENVPVCKWDELGEDKDPLRLPHYCAHWDALSAGQKIYFKEFHWQYNYREHKLLEHAFNIGIFVKKMCSYDTKTAHYCQENEDGQDINSLISYIQGLDYTLKKPENAESFLKCFKELHKDEIYTDDQGRIHIEGSFESSQDTNGLTDSQNSQSSNTSQKTNKRYASPAATLSSIQSMQSASSIKSAPKENSLDNRHNEESNNTLADINGLQELLPGLTNNSDSAQPNPFPELDIKQFVTGLLMSTMTTVNNAQLQMLYDGLRPLVARYAPDCLNQFISLIHKIDRNMPSELNGVKLNTIPARAPETPRIITTTTIPTQQTPGLPKIIRKIMTADAGSSSNPLILESEEKPKITRTKKP